MQHAPDIVLSNLTGSQAAELKQLGVLAQDELKKLCGENVPSWISFPAFERVRSNSCFWCLVKFQIDVFGVSSGTWNLVAGEMVECAARETLASRCHGSVSLLFAWYTNDIVMWHEILIVIQQELEQSILRPNYRYTSFHLRELDDVQATSAIIKDSVEPILEQYRPAVFASIKFDKLSLGNVPPQIEGLLCKAHLAENIL